MQNYENQEFLLPVRKENGEKSHRTATTFYPCLLSHLGDLKGASRMTPATAKVRSFLSKAKKFIDSMFNFLSKFLDFTLSYKKLQKMKELHIIRHAKSSWNIQGLPDEYRPLNDQGYYDAPHMAKWFSNQNKKGVDLLISSPAIRAYTTCSFFASALNYKKNGIVFEPILFHATPEAIESVVFSIPDEINVVCIFGHNPGFTWFSNIFLSDPLDNLPTCGVVSLKSSARHWHEFLPGKIIGQHFMSPKKLHR